jgi:hypothetical protein
MTCSPPTPLLRLRARSTSPACRRQWPLEQRASERAPDCDAPRDGEAVGCVRRAVKRTVADMEVEQGGRISSGTAFPSLDERRRWLRLVGGAARAGERRGGVELDRRPVESGGAAAAAAEKIGGRVGDKVSYVGFGLFDGWMDGWMQRERDAKPN